MTLTKRYCRVVWIYLCLALLTTGIVSCSEKEGANDAQGIATWRTSSEVSASEGSAAIQITGTLGASWSAEITDGTSWCSFKLSDPTASTKSGVVQSAANMNVLDVYYKTNSESSARKATIEFCFVGGTPQTLTLTQLTSSSTNDPYTEGHAKAWAELPVKEEDPNYIYLTHFAGLDGRNVRNFSLCYDKKLHVAHWVAYPMHTAYRGSASRDDNFTYDPKIDYDYQPNLKAGSYSGSYDRGHQIPSADRTANAELNAQTFYATNMTPQLGSLNRYMWANLETKVRDNMCADTLYVVTGCYYADTNTTTTDKSGMKCPVPTNYFKVLLRTKNGQTGKKVTECSADELKAIGFWVEQRSYSSTQPSTEICRSVAEIEQITGFTFFPNIDEEVAKVVKAQNAPSQWGIQ